MRNFAAGCVCDKSETPAYMLFDDYPFPRPEDPDREWFAPHWALVPIDELPGEIVESARNRIMTENA